MPAQIKSKRGLLKSYDGCSTGVREYFEHIPTLVEQYPLDVVLAYAFARLELGQNMALYCGAVKVHKANAEVATKAVSTHHMTREGFVDLYATVFGFDLPSSAAKALKTAEDTRDAVMHGKRATDDRLRNAIARVLEYAEAINGQLSKKHQLRPFGNLRGFSGRAKKLGKSTTRFMLKGMGFTLS